jgi:transposase
MSLRAEFVALASQDGANIRALCRYYGITPATAYKWLRRFQTEGPVGIVNRSTRPHFSPRRTAEESQALILALALRHPYWGARKLKAYLEQHGHSMPAASTVHAILLRQGHRFYCVRGTVRRLLHRSPLAVSNTMPPTNYGKWTLKAISLWLRDAAIR